VADAQVAVLGGGIAGCLTACLLADAGYAVVIVEAQDDLMTGASLWNDGKIHLGYTFTGTPSLATARLMQEGAAAFLPTLERVLGGSLPAEASADPVIYIVDRDPMVPAETLWERAQAVTALLVEGAARSPGLARWVRPDDARRTGRHAPLERLTPEQAEAETGQGSIAAAWRTVEAHLATRVVAEAVRRAVRERGIPVVAARIAAIEPASGRWLAHGETGEAIGAEVIVNCTWENRAVLDRSLVPVSDPVSIRYKVALFGQGSDALRGIAPSTRILGRYGDVVRTHNGEAYLSWYPAGLLARSDDGVPPAIPVVDSTALTDRILDGLGLPRSVVEGDGSTWEVRGGYVVAHGHGDIDRPDSPLHERDRPGVRELRPGYLSVDTGKYTLGPLMALRAAAIVRERLGRPGSGARVRA